jgi:hypothetical protein
MAGQKDLIHETSTTTGTGNFTTAAVNGKVQFGDATNGFGTGGTNVFDYYISNRDVAGEWEHGTGHCSALGTLIRDTVIAGSNGTSLVSFTAGTKDVTNDVPAAQQVRRPSSSTDKAAARFSGTDGGTIQNSALIIDDTTGRISRAGNGGIPVQGTNTNDSAAAGDVGEYISATLTAGSAVSVAVNTAKTVTSISLPAGDWDVSGTVIYIPNNGGGTTVSEIDADLSQVTNSFDSTVGRYTVLVYQASGSLFDQPSISTPTARFSVSTTTTVFLIAFASFAVSTMSAYGFIRARRAR